MAIIKKNGIRIKENGIRIKQLLPCFTVSRLQRINGRFYNWVI
jgi:hypothetical protein